MTTTLAIDCGGSFLKSAVFDAAGTQHGETLRRPTPYPLPPSAFVKVIAEIAKSHPKADRISVGLPGMIRHGVVIHTPHYINQYGPFTPVQDELAAAWKQFDVQGAITSKLGLPTKVVNDAEMHGAGVIAGRGLEVVFTLGTGLGSAVFDGGILTPHLELSHATVRGGIWYDHWIGEAERRRVGTAIWNRRVRLTIERWYPVFRWDRLYLGGGNSRLISQTTSARLGDDVVIVPNAAGLLGGERIWSISHL